MSVTPWPSKVTQLTLAWPLVRTKYSGPLVVADACADRTDELHRSNLRDLGAKYADVIDSAEVLERFTSI